MKASPMGWVFAVLVVLSSSRFAGAAPLVHDPVIVVTRSGASFIAVSVTGSGFGSGTASSLYVDVSPTPPASTTIPSNDPRIVVWSDQQIVAKLDPSFVGIAVRVSTPAGDSATVPAEYYRYDSYNTAVGSAGGPYDAAVAPNGVVWISEQFSTDLKYWSPSDQAVHALTMPHGPGPGAFAMVLPLYGEFRTWSSAYGDDIDLDDHNRIWFSQGGGGAYDGQYPNHSRIVSYDPSTTAFRIWNVPGDHNEVTYVGWDTAAQRLWFAERRRDVCNTLGTASSCAPLHDARIMTFFPDAGYVPPNNGFDFDTAATTVQCNGFQQNAYPNAPTPGVCSNNSNQLCATSHDCVLANQICPPDVIYDYWCYHSYAVPNATRLGQIVVHQDPQVTGQPPLPKYVWFTRYLPYGQGQGGALGRLDPAQAVSGSNPIAWATPGFWDAPTDPAVQALGTRPLDFRIDADGTRVFLEAGAARIGTFFLFGPYPIFSQLQIPNACVDSSGSCVPNASLPPPVVDKTPIGMARDRDGRLWFSELGGTGTVPTTTLGIVNQAVSRISLLPPLSLFESSPAFSGASLDVDPATGDVWFAQYTAKRLGRLQKVPVAYAPSVEVERTNATFSALAVTGSGFGAPRAGSSIVIKRTSGSKTINSTDTQVIKWSDREVAVKIAVTPLPTMAKIQTPGGTSAQVAVSRYRYDSFPVWEDTTGTLTGDIDLDAAERVWIVEEFATQNLKYWDAANGGSAQNHIPIPGAYDKPPPFLFGPSYDSQMHRIPPSPDKLTWNSQFGEDNEIDDQGRVWFSQSGGDDWPTYPNHSRIVNYDPASGTFRIWNVPGNQTRVGHVTWDRINHRLWFTESRHDICNTDANGNTACSVVHPMRVVTFYPDAGGIAYDNAFDFIGAASQAQCLGFQQNDHPPTLGQCSNNANQPCVIAADCVHADQLCPPGGGPDPSCYRTYDSVTPNVILSGHVKVDEAGRVYYADYLGSDPWGVEGVSIERLDPNTGTTVRFPLGPTEIPPASVGYTDNPWPVEIMPASLGGHVVVGEYGQSRVARLDGARLDDPACQTLVSPSPGVDCGSFLYLSTCRNPCIAHLTLPNYCDTDLNTGLCIAGAPGESVEDKGLKGVRFDSGGTIWLGFQGGVSSTPDSSVAMLRPPWARIVTFPPLSVFVSSSPVTVASVGINSSANRIWFPDFYRNEVSRLQKLTLD